MLLLSSIVDMSQIPPRQAIVFLSDANELLQNFRLLPDVRQMLETFVLSLSLLIGDDAKAATEAQLLHTLHYSGSYNKGDGLGSSGDGDIVTFSLVLHHLVCCFYQSASRISPRYLVDLQSISIWFRKRQ